MQDVIPPINRQPRGALRPPARLVPDRPRLVEREAIRPVRSIDGMTNVRQTSPVVATKPLEAPLAEPVAVATVAVPFVPEVVLEEPQVIAAVEPPATAPPATAPIAQSEEVSKKLKKKVDWERWLLIALAIGLLVVTGYVTIDTWLANNKVANELSAPVVAAVVADGTETIDQEGKDETKPTANTLSRYTVAATLPRALYIEKLNVSARILPMAVNNKGSIQAPLNIYDSGWYTDSVKPGETGALFIDGHASGPTREGLFAYLDTLVEGDTVQVEKGDGAKLTYKVVHVDVIPLADIDMKKVLLPYENVTKGLNLMTCTGKWLPKEYTYDHRVVVYTQQL